MQLRACLIVMLLSFPAYCANCDTVPASPCVAASSAAYSSSTTVTAPAAGSKNTTGATSMHILGTSFNAACPSPTIADALSNTWGSPTVTRSDGGQFFIYVWEIISGLIAGPNETVTMSCAGATLFPSVAWEALNTASLQSFSTSTKANQGSGTTVASGTITPTANGALLIGGCEVANIPANVTSLDNGFTTATNLSTGVNSALALGWLVQSTAGAIGTSCTLSTGIYNGSAAFISGYIPLVPLAPPTLGALLIQ